MSKQAIELRFTKTIRFSQSEWRTILDSASEAKVQQALDRLMVDRTSLVVAHRLSTIENADAILVVDARGERLLVEHTHSAEGEHLFLFPMAGRLVHEGLGALAAYRFTRDSGATIQVSMND